MWKYPTFWCSCPSSCVFCACGQQREALFIHKLNCRGKKKQFSLPVISLCFLDFYFLYIKVDSKVMVNRLGNLAKTKRFNSFDTDECVRASWGPSCVTFQERHCQGASTLQTSDALQCKERDLLTAACSDRPFQHRRLKQTSSQRKPALCAPTVAARLSTKTQPLVTFPWQTTHYFTVEI